MKAIIDIDAVIGGVRVHAKAGEPLPQALADHWALSGALQRAVKQGLVEDDEAPAPVAAPKKQRQPEYKKDSEE